MSQNVKRLFALWAIIVAIGWAVIIAYSIHAAMPYNPIKLPLEKRFQFRTVLTQGWKFFTRNPREEDIYLFSRDPNGNWTNSLRGANGEAKNLFGIKRDTRAQGIEIGLIMSHIKQSQWVECETSPTSCLNVEGVVKYINNSTPSPKICGEYGLVLPEPVPWAWSGSRKSITMPSKTVRFFVLC